LGKDAHILVFFIDIEHANLGSNLWSKLRKRNRMCRVFLAGYPEYEGFQV